MTCKRDNGAMAILMAATVSILFMLTAWLMQQGLIRQGRADAQTTADASALAGANFLDKGVLQAVAQVKTYARMNGGVRKADWNSCTARRHLRYVVPGETTCISFDRSVSPTRILVVLPSERVPSFFGGNTWITASAQAQRTTDGSYLMTPFTRR